jgi:hypothetical protein
MARKWPESIEEAVARALLAGVPTVTILRRLRSGELAGLNRAYDLPNRSYYDLLKRVRERMLANSFAPKPESEGRFMAELRRKAVEAPPPIASPPVSVSSVSGPQRPVESRKAALLRELERLSENEELESLPGSEPGSGQPPTPY